MAILFADNVPFVLATQKQLPKCVQTDCKMKFLWWDQQEKKQHVKFNVW